jgi:hypothetical protein
MTLDRLKFFFLTKVMAVSLVMPLCAYASVVTIKNDDSADIEVVIEPGEGSIIKSANQLRQTVKPKQEQKIEVTREVMGNAETFSVTGKVKMPSLYNRCGPLLIDKDYRVIFVGSKTGGTICVSEPSK